MSVIGDDPGDFDPVAFDRGRERPLNEQIARVNYPIYFNTGLKFLVLKLPGGLLGEF